MTASSIFKLVNFIFSRCSESGVSLFWKATSRETRVVYHCLGGPPVFWPNKVAWRFRSAELTVMSPISYLLLVMVLGPRHEPRKTPP
jgi:hypothetical protein